MSNRFESLPSHVQTNRVETPSFEVGKIFSHEGSVAVETITSGMVRKFFVDGVDSVEDSDPVVLVDEVVSIGIDSERATCHSCKSSEGQE